MIIKLVFVVKSMDKFVIVFFIGLILNVFDVLVLFVFVFNIIFFVIVVLMW